VLVRFIPITTVVGLKGTWSGTASSAYPPLTQYNGVDGAGQMTHFVNDDKYNVFRLPVGWQFLTNNVATGTLDQANFAKYDALVQACLATGASCIIDIHNYARWNGQVCIRSFSRKFDVKIY